jgi:hypothetical protein
MHRVDKLPMTVYNSKLLQAEGNAGSRGSDSEAQTADNLVACTAPKNK